VVETLQAAAIEPRDEQIQKEKLNCLLAYRKIPNRQGWASPCCESLL
jgi:hypothetical protein